MTWKKGDTVVHLRDGICEITGTAEMGRQFEKPDEYYVLQPLYETASKLYIPIARADRFLRDPLTKEEAEALIRRIPEMDTVWITDEKKRQAMLLDARKNASIETLLSLVHLFYEKKQEYAQAGRRFHTTDEQFLKDMDVRICREFAYTLGITPAEVPDYIRDRV
ncbi:MAG: CarD family transcriptional regulator [Lachnospiraceae bacterium]|nr:CarD family transcriptional regulator [Lachnospiraceae bacterium]